MEAWLPNYKMWWDLGLEKNLIIPLGKSLDDNWQSGFVVPAYMVRGDPVRGIVATAPGLRTVHDLRKYADQFEQNDGRISLVNCTKDWACSDSNREKIAAYQLGDVIELKDPGSGEALTASLERAYERGDPWLGYAWGPTKVDTELELIALEEPPYSVNCWNSDKGCAYPVSQIRIVVHPSLIERAPDVILFLLKWDLDTETQVLVEEKYSELNSLDETAVWFLKNHEVVWTIWVPPEVAETIKKVLRDR